MQATCRVGVLATLFERYDPNKAFQKKFWVPVTWEKILETSKVREAIFQNSLFEPKIIHVPRDELFREGTGHIEIVRPAGHVRIPDYDLCEKDR